MKFLPGNASGEGHEGSKILFHLQTNELARYSFISIGRRHKTPGSETKDFITHFITLLLSKQHEFHVPIFSSCLQVPCGEWDDGPR